MVVFSKLKCKVQCINKRIEDLQMKKNVLSTSVVCFMFHVFVQYKNQSLFGCLDCIPARDLTQYLVSEFCHLHVFITVFSMSFKLTTLNSERE